MEESTSEPQLLVRPACKSSGKASKNSAEAPKYPDSKKPDLLRAFGETVAILSRDKRFRHMTLVELVADTKKGEIL